mgnify:CR=1 FL=1
MHVHACMYYPLLPLPLIVTLTLTLTQTSAPSRRGTERSPHRRGSLLEERAAVSAEERAAMSARTRQSARGESRRVCTHTLRGHPVHGNLLQAPPRQCRSSHAKDCRAVRVPRDQGTGYRATGYRGLETKREWYSVPGHVWRGSVADHTVPSPSCGTGHAAVLSGRPWSVLTFM